MLCVEANGTGQIVVDDFQPVDPSECQGHVLVTPAEYSVLTNAINVDPVSLGASWAFAFATAMTFWAWGYKLKVSRQGINSVK
jgi:hypothetical protein